MGVSATPCFLELNMKRRKLIGFHTTPEVDKAVEAERRRLTKKMPGGKVNKSDAVRSLIIKASTRVTKVED